MDILTEVVPFSNDWWDIFLNKNKNFSETMVLEDAINYSECNFLKEECKKVIQQICNKGTNNYGFRIYLENKEQDNNFLVDFFKKGPQSEETIEEWTKRIFKDQKFGIILNKGEKFSNDLTKKISSMIEPLLKKAGIPLTGLDLTIFVGNYGWTPLGIHQDHTGENVIHFHLGPGPKDMYIWNPEEYKKHPDFKENNQNVEPMLKYAQKFPFKTGDIFYMPWDKYHIGFSDELSIGITLWFNNPTKERFTRRIVESFSLQYFAEGKNVLEPEKNLIKSETFSNITSMLNIDEKIQNLNMIDFLEHLHDDYKISIESNRGWASLPLSLFDEIGFVADEEYQILENKNITTPYPFKHYHRRDDENLIVFTRGTKLELSYHKELVQLIESLNTNEILEVNKLLYEICKEIPLEAGMYFLALIYDKRGIEIVEK